MNELEKKLNELKNEKAVNIVITVKNRTIGDFYTDGFWLEKMEGYWEITLDDEINTIYVDDDKFSDIDVSLGIIMIDYY